MTQPGYQKREGKLEGLSTNLVPLLMSLALQTAGEFVLWPDRGALAALGSAGKSDQGRIS